MQHRKRVILDAMQIQTWQLRGADPPPQIAMQSAPHGSLSGLPRTVASDDAVDSLGWDELRARVAACTLCGLCKSRTQTVFGTGVQSARWMIVGEAPGAEEDARGEPFVGQAGKLLDNMLVSIGLSRTENVYIANVLKCRPPGNRNPEPAEVACCSPYLQRQIELLAPDMVVIMGRFAAQSLLQTDSSIASLRGRVHELNAGGRRIKAVVSYHPAYLLRNLPEKAKSWADLQLAQQLMQKIQVQGGSVPA
jgi:uracil-DNA glycosylase